MEDSSLAWRVATTLFLLVVGYLVLYGLGLLRRKGDEPAREYYSSEQSETKVEKIAGCAMDFADWLPADRVFTLETLAEWDGNTMPMCVAVCGKVLDVSSSENFNPIYGYGKLWGGRDASYALAFASLNPADANVLDWDLEEFGNSQKESLKSFYKHFVEKYPVIGTLKEYEFRDFGDFLPEVPDAAKGLEAAAEQAAGGDGDKASEEASGEAAAKTASED